MLRLPGSVRTYFSETRDLCASKALVTLVRPPGGRMKKQRLQSVCRCGRKEWDQKRRGGDTCSEDNRTNEEGPLRRKEGARTHAHLSQLHERVDVF